MTAARELVTDALEANGASRAEIADANIVVGELVMNAIRHGRPLADDTVEITWASLPDALRFGVLDGGHVDELTAQMPSVDATGGRGLAMVEIMCLRWSYDTTDGTRVIADIPSASVRQAG